MKPILLRDTAVTTKKAKMTPANDACVLGTFCFSDLQLTDGCYRLASSVQCTSSFQSSEHPAFFWFCFVFEFPHSCQGKFEKKNDGRISQYLLMYCKELQTPSLPKNYRPPPAPKLIGLQKVIRDLSQYFTKPTSLSFYQHC